MAAVTLSEQMGAMAIVDDLRHRQLIAKEHLSLPERREEVVRRIRDYYQSKGIDADDALIEQGVREYFSKRLAFEAPEMSWFARMVTNVLISRKEWIPALGGIAIATIIGTTAVYGGIGMYHSHQVGQVEVLANKLIKGTAKMHSAIATQRADLAGLRTLYAGTDIPAGVRVMDGVQEMIDEAERLTSSVVLPTAITVESLAEDDKALAQYMPKFNEADRILRNNRVQLNATEGLYRTSKSFHALVDSQRFHQAALRFPELTNLESVAAQAISSADTTGIVEAAHAVNVLVATFNEMPWNALDAMTARNTELMRAFAELALPADEMAKVKALSSRLTASIQKLDNASAQSTLKLMTGLLDFARAELTLSVVDRVGVKSGVERSLRLNKAKPNTQGQSWYLITEALDPAGTAIQVPVTSAETGTQSMAAIFGVRVSSDEFQRIKADKLADGHVDDRHMGTKPANSLSVKYINRISPNPDMITEW